MQAMDRGGGCVASSATAGVTANARAARVGFSPMARSPEPWTVGIADDGVYIDAAGYTIAQVFGLRGNENARLIAAAPEMLALLEELEWSTKGDRRDENWCPICEGWFKQGHKPDCRLGNLLTELRK